MKPAKVRETIRVALLTTAGALALQLPIFFALLKLTSLAGCEEGLSKAGQRLMLGDSFNSTDVPLDIDSRSPALTANYSGPGPSAAVPRLLPGVIDPRRPAFKPLSEARYPFVLYSAYRHTLETIYVLGITSAALRKHENDRPVKKCEWFPRNGSQILYDRGISADAHPMYGRGDENGMAYVPVIVNCTFNQSVGADGLGGILRLVISVTSHREPNVVTEDVLQELPGEVEKILVADESRLPLKYAYCSPPMFGTNNTDWIRSWLAYHHHLWGGEAHFFLYDVGGIDGPAKRVLQPWIDAGLLTIFDATRGGAYSGWYRNQVLFINDCIYRTRFMARWTFIYDFDEMLYVAGPKTLEGLLEENADSPWISFGSWPFSVSHCRNSSSPKEEWPLERMLWRHKQPECTNPELDPWMCVSASGRRKLVVNPRKVFMCGVHQVVLPENGGVDLNASVARVTHFQGVLRGSGPCGITVYKTQDGNEGLDDYYAFDDTLASVIPKAREFARDLLLSR